MKTPFYNSDDSNQEPKGGKKMNDQELFKQVISWSYHHCRDLWKEYHFNSSPEKRKHAARKILIEKVKKEPDTELLISQYLKEKILLMEGVDLKRINYEYQEKKGSSKVKQEPDTELLISPGLKENILIKEGVDLKRINYEYREKKGSSKVKHEPQIYNQEPVEDNDIDDDEIINLILYDQLKKEWNKFRWYSIPSIASKMGKHRKTVVYWRDFGLKVNGSYIRLKMIKRPFQWYSKGKWIIDFFLKTNADVDME